MDSQNDVINRAGIGKKTVGRKIQIFDDFRLRTAETAVATHYLSTRVPLFQARLERRAEDKSSFAFGSGTRSGLSLGTWRNL